MGAMHPSIAHYQVAFMGQQLEGDSSPQLPASEADLDRLVEVALAKIGEAGLDESGRRLLALELKRRELLLYLEAFSPNERKQFAVKLLDEIMKGEA